MRIGSLLDISKALPALADEAQEYADTGFHHVWSPQIFGYDALTMFAALASKVSGIEFGTGVVPVYGRHPQVLAQQALTVQAASAGRLNLGIGLSHQIVVEGLWGLSFATPARYMREYLAALMPLLAGESVNAQGELVTANTYAPLEIPDATAPSVLVAALGSTMLKTAGTVAAGTITWMTGIDTIGNHVTPTIAEAAKVAGRPAPRVAVSLPVTVTADIEGAKERIDRDFAIYPTLPSYKAMLDREGAERPSDVAFVGSVEAVSAKFEALAQAGATDFVAAVIGNENERKETKALLASLNG